jgi:thiol-disulfide isomerase/thioredoxin
MGRYALMLAMLLLAAASGAQDNKGTVSAATAEDTLKPYQRYTGLPAFNILEMDSTTVFNTYNIPKGSVTALMLFSPDCKHCKRTIDALCKSMDSVSDVHFYLVTAYHSMTDIKKFYEEHHLSRYKNVEVVGMDYEFFYFTYYKTKFVPDVALYDKNKKLITLIEGETDATAIYNKVHGITKE